MGENKVGFLGVTTVSLARKEKFFGLKTRLRFIGEATGDVIVDGDEQKFVSERGVLQLIPLAGFEFG